DTKMGEIVKAVGDYIMLFANTSYRVVTVLLAGKHERFGPSVILPSLFNPTNPSDHGTVTVHMQKKWTFEKAARYFLGRLPEIKRNATAFDLEAARNYKIKPEQPKEDKDKKAEGKGESHLEEK